MQIATNSWQHSIVLGDKWVNKYQPSNNEVTSVTHIEDLERHFLEEDLCDNNYDRDSGNYVLPSL